MTEAARILNQTFRRVAGTQALLVAAAMAAGAVFARPPAHVAMSVAYGGAVSMLIAWRLARSLNAATPSPSAGPGASARLFLGAAERFVLSSALLAFGLAVMKLSPLAIVIGFATAQLGFIGGVSPLPGARRVKS